jgi:hypothetical protein
MSIARLKATHKSFIFNDIIATVLLYHNKSPRHSRQILTQGLSVCKDTKKTMAREYPNQFLAENLFPITLYTIFATQDNGLHYEA